MANKLSPKVGRRKTRLIINHQPNTLKEALEATIAETLKVSNSDPTPTPTPKSTPSTTPGVDDIVQSAAEALHMNHIPQHTPNSVTRSYNPPIQHADASQDPRDNRFESTLHCDNLASVLKAQADNIMREVDDVDTRIAELQAIRTDLMRAYSGISKAMDAIS